MKHIAIISAIFLIAMLAICPASAVGKYYESKYAEPTDNLPVVEGLNKYQGVLIGSIRCHVNTFTNKIGVRNDLDKNGSFKFYPILPDGQFANTDGSYGIPLIPGEFTLYLEDGNGGQPEYSHVTIKAGAFSYPDKELLGHAISQGDARYRTLTITKATYGATREVCEQVNHNEYRYWIHEVGHWSGYGHSRRWIVDVPAHWSEWSTQRPHGCGYQTKTVSSTVCHTEGQFIDVTSIVQSKVVNGGLNLIADYPNLGYNQIFTDPTPGIFKTLSVDYTIDGGAAIHKTVQEDENLLI